MNRAQLVEAIASDTNSGIDTKAGADRALESVLCAIESGLKKDGSVSLVGFGTFRVKSRAERMGRNPQTGEQIKIAASKSVGFKPSPELKKAL